MDTLLQDLRYAIRSLRKAPVLTAATVLTLGLGIGANSAMFGVVDRLFLRPPALVVDPGRVVRVNVTRVTPLSGAYASGIGNYPRYLEARDLQRGFSSVAGYFEGESSFGLGTQAQPVRTGMVTASFFPLLGIHPALGRFFGADEDRADASTRSAVLSYGFWQREFAHSPDVLGRSVRVGRGVYTVVGVAPAGFTGVSLRSTDVWLPLNWAVPQVMGARILGCERCDWPLEMIARLAPGADAGRMAGEMTSRFRSHTLIGDDSSATVSLSSVNGAVGDRDRADLDANLSLWLAAVSAIVLLIACANVANLLLVRGIRRRREVAVRVALGAGRWRLIRQLYAESALLAAGGGVAAVLVNLWMGPILETQLLPGTTIATTPDLRILLFTIVVAAITALVAGLPPALHSRMADVSIVLKNGAPQGSATRSATRSGLLATQIALTVVLLAGAGLFLGSLRQVRHLRLGFDANQLIVVSADFRSAGYQAADIGALYQRMQARVSQLPGIAAASLAIGSPFRSTSLIEVSVPGRDSLPQIPSGGPWVSAVAPEYFRTLGTAIREGRAFNDGDRAGSRRVTIVSETMARLIWPGESPIGRCLRIGRAPAPCTEIVGITEDARVSAVTDRLVMQYFIPLAQADSLTIGGPPDALLVRTSGPAEAVVGAVQRDVRAMAPDLPYVSVDPMPRLFADQLRTWRLGSSLLTLFGGLALVLAAGGLYGVLSYVVSQRTRELGIRVALGAPRGGVLWLVMGAGLRIAGAGIAAGLICALVAGRIISSMLYGIAPDDPLVLFSVAALLVSVATAASYFPARRATRVDPMEALRAE